MKPPTMAGRLLCQETDDESEECALAVARRIGLVLDGHSCACGCNAMLHAFVSCVAAPGAGVQLSDENKGVAMLEMGRMVGAWLRERTHHHQAMCFLNGLAEYLGGQIVEVAAEPSPEN